jgi:hypothetical protein
VNGAYPEYFQRFGDDIGRGTAFEVVLRGHLWVESELVRSLTQALPFPEVANLDRLSFPHKVALVAAHGLMREDEQPGFLRLNALRNQLAHTLEADVDESHEQALVNALGPRHRHDMEALRRYNPQRFPNDLRNAVAVLCFLLQEDRARHREESHRQREQEPRLYDGL